MKGKKLKIVFTFAVIMTMLGCGKKPVEETVFPKINLEAVTTVNEEETTTEPEKYVAEYEYTEGYENIDRILNEEKYTDLVAFIEKHFIRFQGSVLVAINGEIIVANGYGYADELNEIPNTMNTTYELGLASLQFTADAVFDMVEDGLLELDTDIKKFFPEITTNKKITVEDLLYNSSGLPNYLNDQDAFENGEELKNVIRLAVENGEEPQENFLIDYLKDVELLFEPGEGFHRSNTNYYLLALIIERVSGLEFEDYIKDYVFEKHGMRMSNLAYQGTSAVASYDEEPRLSYPVNLVRGVMTANSNVIELYKWGQYMMDDVLADKEDYRTILMTGYGSMDGETQGFVSRCVFDPETDSAIIILSNDINQKNFIDGSLNVLLLKLNSYLEQK
ncbi:MAG: beta-lactamase family protein [Lachnospiraceae bacterium]|nr:beta-lactamase family protein [Lachnospiraceae bacterium]